MPDHELSRPAAAGGAFPSTHWSLLVRVRKKDADSDAALEEICRRYWYPIYAFLRRNGQAPSDAEDVTQAFFIRVLSQEMLLAPSPEKGRLRSFLLGALKRHLIDHYRVANAAKRGGGRAPLPIEWDTAEERYSIEPADEMDPEKLYYKAWAVELLRSVKQRLGETVTTHGRGETFRLLEPFLEGENSDLSYAEIARQLGSTEPALRVQIFRLRRKYRELIEEEIARTLGGEEDVEDEVAWLMTVLGR